MVLEQPGVSDHTREVHLEIGLQCCEKEDVQSVGDEAQVKRIPEFHHPQKSRRQWGSAFAPLSFWLKPLA
jgi:hypothetical protein